MHGGKLIQEILACHARIVIKIQHYCNLPEPPKFDASQNIVQFIPTPPISSFGRPYDYKGDLLYVLGGKAGKEIFEI